MKDNKGRPITANPLSGAGPEPPQPYVCITVFLTVNIRHKKVFHNHFFGSLFSDLLKIRKQLRLIFFDVPAVIMPPKTGFVAVVFDGDWFL